MKLIVQIPCYNEAEALPEVIATIPRQIAGVDMVEVLVVDDGSTDSTADVARRAGADHVVRHTRNRGLAAAFRTALDVSLHLGADIIVNTDGDNQYPQERIPELIGPILRGEADVVIGDRRPVRVAHFSPLKRVLHVLGSQVVCWLAGIEAVDAPSGFRAFSREAALRLHVISDYSYTLETIIQAGKERMALACLPIEPQRTRPSRLQASLWDFLKQQATTIVRVYAMYEPLRVFSYTGVLVMAVGLAGVLRFLYFFLFTPAGGVGHIQSLVLSAIFLIIGFQTLLIGLVADLIRANRRLIEEILYRVRKLDRGETELAERGNG